MKKIILLGVLLNLFYNSDAQKFNQTISTQQNQVFSNTNRIEGGNSVFAAPGNDLCSGATVVTPDGTCITGTTVEATDNWTNTVGCQNGTAASNHPDVWYSFVATASEWTSNITTGGGWAGDVELTLVSGSCTAGFTLAGYDCGPSPLIDTINGLQIGTTYYFTISNASGGTTGSFTVCPNNITPPVISGQDCSTAAILCNNSLFTQGSSTAGFGTQEVNTSNSCWGSGGERQSKWFKFTVGCGGTLEFMITPNNYNSSTETGDDYDWAIWKMPTISTCPSTTATTYDALACNWSGCVGATGMSSTPGTSFGLTANTSYQANNPAGPGTCDPGTGLPIQWENTITVAAGDVYALLIDNYTTSNNGFSFIFGGTATIGPDAAFTYTATGCNAYNFTKTCQVSNSTFNWTFGDGGTSTSQNPSHTFTSSGVFTVTLEVTDALGCTKIYSETFTVGFPDATASASSNITCSTPSVTLTGSSTTSGATYSWSGPGIVSGGATATPTVNASGTYTVTVTNPANACTNTATVSVTSNTTTPNVNAGADATLTCASSSTTLTGSSSTGGATFAWTGPSIVSGATTPTVTVNGSGTYTLTVTDPSNGCTATDQAVVTPDANIPNVNAGSDQTLTCSTTSLVLNGSSSTSGVNYSWSGPGIVSGGTTATPTVNTAGTYALTVTDPGNGCTATDQVVVNLNNTVPNVNAGSDMVITCTVPTVQLSGSSTTSGVTYSWAGTGISSGGATATPTINAAGSFTLTITDPTNGCTATDIAAVTTNTTTPDANAGSSQTITCINTSVTLSGSSATSGATFSWSGPSIVSGSSSASALVNGAGTYTLTVTDPSNGCTNTANVTVSTNTTVPNVNAGPDQTITCSSSTVDLTGSSSTPNTSFSWAGPSITTSPNAATITVNGVGTYTLTVTDDINGCTATDQAIVSPDANLPNVNAGADQMLTCTVTSVVLNGSSTTAGVNFSWSGPSVVSGGTTTTPTVDAAGTYTLTVTDPGNGCTSTDQVIVSTNTVVPNVSAGSGQTLTCTQTSVQLNGSSTTSGATFSWSGPGIVSGANTATPTVNAAGDYTVTVTDPTNDCTNDAAVTVTTNTLTPDVNAGTNDTLTCIITTLQLNGSSITAGVSYSWAGSGIVSGGNTATPTINAPDTYTLTVTDPANGCTSTGVVNIAQIITTPDASAGSDVTLTCTATSVTLNGSSSTSNVSYSWAGSGIVSGGNTATPVVNIAGAYTLTVTDNSNGCTNTSVVNVLSDSNLPNVNAGNNQTITCIATSATLNGSSTSSGVTYSWAGPNSFTSTSQTPTVTDPGTYTLTVTDPANSCSSSQTVSVVTDNAIPDLTITAPVTTIDCTNPSANLGATSTVSGSQITWANSTGPISGNPVVATTADTYSVVVVNPANGCTNSSSVTITGNASVPTLIASTTADTINCITPSAVLSASSTTGGVTYSWSGPGGFTSSSANPGSVSVAGNYVVVVTDPSNGCVSTDTLKINQGSDPTASFTTITSGTIAPVTVNFTNTSINATSYVWNFGNSTGSIQQNPSAVVYDTPGSYTVTLVASGGNSTCNDTTTAVIVVDAEPIVVVPNIFSPNGDNINDQFIITVVGFKEMTIEIFNRWGTKMASFNPIAGEYWNGDKASEGTYFYIVKGIKNDDSDFEQHGTVMLVK